MTTKLPALTKAQAQAVRKAMEILAGANLARLKLTFVATRDDTLPPPEGFMPRTIVLEAPSSQLVIARGLYTETHADADAFRKAYDL